MLMRQQVVVKVVETPGYPVDGILSTIKSHNYSNSWALGPKAGFAGNWLLDGGFRFEGNLEGSLLFTQYTSVKHSEEAGSTAYNVGPYTYSLSNINTIRPSVECGLGLGWGTYFMDNDFHVDLAVDYDFLFFWSQNMIREMVSNLVAGTGYAAPSLYLHGLTFTSRFDF
jgi:hypothetical protein